MATPTRRSPRFSRTLQLADSASPRCLNEEQEGNSIPQPTGETGAQVLQSPIPITNVSLKHVYTYFSKLTRADLRPIGRIWKRKSVGPKIVQVYRMYRYVKNRQHQEGGMRAVIASNIYCPNLDKFLSDMQDKESDFFEPPADPDVDYELAKHGDPAEAPLVATPESSPHPSSPPAPQSSLPSALGAQQGELVAFRTESANSPDFSLSEFSRLIVIMKEDERARAALLKLGQELSRAQLDAGVCRDHFWGEIANRFNDATYRPTFSFVGSVDEADCSALPLTTRAAGTLKSHFHSVRSKFTLYKDRWEVSGNMDPQTFPNFLPSCRGTLYALSKRVWIIFIVSRMGTPYEDTFLLQMSTKCMAAGISHDEGVPDEADSIRADEEGRRRARRSSRTTDPAREFQAIASAVKEMASSEVQSQRKLSSSFSMALHDEEDLDKLCDLVFKAQRRLTDAKRTADAEEDQTMVEVAKMQYDRVLSKYKQRSREELERDAVGATV